MSEIAKALVAAQSKMRNPVRNAENPHFRSKFADLAAIREATLPALNEHGLAILHETVMDERGLILRCVLTHVSGETRVSEWPLPTDAPPQQLGSALSYGRRYTWSAMCGVATEDDDDGQQAQAGAERSRRARGAQHRPAPPPDAWESPAGTDEHRPEYEIDRVESARRVMWREFKRALGPDADMVLHEHVQRLGLSSSKELTLAQIKDAMAGVKDLADYSEPPPRPERPIRGEPTPDQVAEAEERARR